jgi:hypothetical protein
MREDLANSKWHYYLDGTEVCTSIATNHNPGSGTNLRYVLGVNNLSTTSEIWTGDAWEIFSF